MEPRANYFTVGLFVIGLLAAFVLAILWFSASQQKEYQIYLVYMQESVSGLSVQAPVKFNGVDVGYVSEIRLNPENSQQVVLKLNIEEGTPVNQSTRATLMTQGITGVMYVGLKPGASIAPSLKIMPGNKYPVIESEPSLLVTLSDALKDASVNFKKISNSVERLLNHENQEAVQNTLANLDKITGALAGSSKELQQSVKNFDATLHTSQTAMQNFSQQLMPSIVQSMSRFNQILNNLAPVTSSLKNNPSILIRGKAPATLGPGEQP